MVAMVHLAVESAKVCLNHRTCAGSLGRLESSATIWTSPIRVAYHYLGTPSATACRSPLSLATSWFPSTGRSLVSPSSTPEKASKITSWTCEGSPDG